MALLRNPKGTVITVLLFLAVFIGMWFLPASCAKAADFEFAAGSTYIRGTTPAVAATVHWPKVVARRADLYAGVMLIGDSTYRGEYQSNQAVFRVGMINYVGNFGMGIGAVLLQNEDIYNSGNLNYNLNITYKIKNWDHSELALRADHISNAGTSKPNLGRDMLFLTYRFK